MNHRPRKTAPTILQESRESTTGLSTAGKSISEKDAPVQFAKLGDPDFENLTTAEKLNDSKYRKMIYRTYPNEPTCKCENKQISRISTCPGGCANSCCSRVRKTFNRKGSIQRNDFDEKMSGRLRGGGEERLGNSENFKRNQFRQNGGGESNCCNQNYNTPMQNDDENCCCPDKAALNSVMQRRSDLASIKKPCLGPGCLIKAFEDAKEFVDSLGKVPGLPGLGLMDPGESPYFGRKYDEDDDATEDSSSNKAVQKSNKNCTGICTVNNTPINNESLPRCPGRIGIVKESVPLLPNFSNSVIPGPKIKKKEKTEVKEDMSDPLVPEETGPCGDPKCRSRKKKLQIEEEDTGILKGSKKRSDDKFNTSNSKDFFTKSKNDRKSAVKIRRRIGRFIYSLGDSYPGVNCGHQHCKKQPDRVPANVGWLWKEQNPPGRLKPRIGWKPGAINSRLRQVLQEVKGNFLPESKSTTSMSRVRKKVTTKKSRGLISAKRKKNTEKIEEEWKEPPPTLHIQRKDGLYYVTMYPIKDDKMDIPKLEEPTKPLQFKIMKSRDDDSENASSIASDMEIEFSPPAAVNRYRKMPDVVHVETQVKQQEIIDAFKPPGSTKIEKKTKKDKKSKK